MTDSMEGLAVQAGKVEAKVPVPAMEGPETHDVGFITVTSPMMAPAVKAPNPATPVGPLQNANLDVAVAGLPPTVPAVPAPAGLATLQGRTLPQPLPQVRAPVALQAAVAPAGVSAVDGLPEGGMHSDDAPRIPRLSGGRGKGRRLVKPGEQKQSGFATPEQRLLLLDTWGRSGLAINEFADIVGISKHTIYQWKKRFEEHGPAGLMDRPRGVGRGSRLPEITKRTILMLKKSNPDWGCQRISDMLVRGPALPASPSAVARVLHEAGYETVEEPTSPHPDHVRSFERAKPNELWQTDLFVFNLKRQNRRVYLIAFLDDHSRFVVSYGLYGSSSTALVLEVLNAGIASYGAPEEILTDNGPQYVTWRGKSAFTKELEKRGIRQIVAHPRRPQTLGKVERFWGTLWRECLEASIFLDVEDARKRVGLFIDWYNFKRPHQGVDGLVPADRFFQAAPDVLRTLKDRVAANALELARHGVPKTPFYLTGQIGGKGFSVHAEGDRMILTRADGNREEIDMNSPRAREVLAEMPQKPTSEQIPEPIAPHGPSRGDENELGREDPPAPGVSPLDEGLKKLEAAAREGGEA